MHYLKLSCFVLLMPICFLLGGCITYSTLGTLPKDFQFDPMKSDEGVVAMAIGCNILNDTLVVGIAEDLDTFKKAFIKHPLLIKNNDFLVSCTADPDDNRIHPEFKFMKLPTGTYSFVYWRSEAPDAGGYRIELEDFPKVTFKVLPHKVTYIGGILLTYGYHEHFRSAFFKPNPEMVPAIHDMLPGIPKRDIILVPFKVESQK